MTVYETQGDALLFLLHATRLSLTIEVTNSKYTHKKRKEIASFNSISLGLLIYILSVHQ